jgi:hypothetical protein
VRGEKRKGVVRSLAGDETRMRVRASRPVAIVRIAAATRVLVYRGSGGGGGVVVAVVVWWWWWQQQRWWWW